LEQKDVPELSFVLQTTIKRLEIQTGVLSAKTWPSAASQFVNCSSELPFLANGEFIKGESGVIK